MLWPENDLLFDDPGSRTHVHTMVLVTVIFCFWVSAFITEISMTPHRVVDIIYVLSSRTNARWLTLFYSLTLIACQIADVLVIGSDPVRSVEIYSNLFIVNIIMLRMVDVLGHCRIPNDPCPTLLKKCDLHAPLAFHYKSECWVWWRTWWFILSLRTKMPSVAHFLLWLVFSLDRVNRVEQSNRSHSLALTKQPYTSYILQSVAITSQCLNVVALIVTGLAHRFLFLAVDFSLNMLR